MKAVLLLSSALFLASTMTAQTAPETEAAAETQPVFNEVSFTGEFVTFSEAKPKFRPVHQAQPVYPEIFLKKGIEGYAVIAFLVDLDGTPKQCQVAEASDPAFGEAARQAIAQWRFSPPEFRGKTGPILMQLPIDFSLAETAAVAPAAPASPSAGG
jgi:TonB family protein